MDLMELIEVVNRMPDDIHCIVSMEELHPLRITYGTDYTPRRPDRPEIEVKNIFEKKDAICYLFDKDIAGWELGKWDVDEPFSNFKRIRIELYRFNCD